MTAPQEEFYPKSRTEALVLLFRIIFRESWDELQSLHEAFFRSCVGHILYGIYALITPPGGVRRLAR